MDKRYDLRKIGIRHEQEDLNSYEAATLMIKEIERLRELNGKIIASFRVNMMRLWPEYSHEEFDKGIAALKESE